MADVEKSEHLAFQFTICRSFPHVSIFVQTLLVVIFHTHVENTLHVVYVNHYNYEKKIISSASENFKVIHTFIILTNEGNVNIHLFGENVDSECVLCKFDLQVTVKRDKFL